MSGGGSASPVAPANALEAAVGTVLDELRTFRLRWWPPLLLGFVMLFDSWDSAAIAYVLPVLVKEWRLDPVAMGTLISAGYAGQLIGALTMGGLAERFGRLPVIAWAVTAMCLLGLICAICPNYETLLPARFLQGLAIGGALPVAVTYINELAPTATRGRYFGTFQFLCLSGYTAAAIASTFIVPHLGWRWMFGLGALPLLLLPVMLATLPESPRWLARAGRESDVRKALARLGAGGRADGLPVGVDSARSVREEAPAIPVSALFGAKYRLRTLVLVTIWFLSSFTSFGLTTWVPSLYVTVFDFPVEEALRYVAIASVVSLFVPVLPALLIDRIGRRPMAMAGAAVSAAGLLSLAFLPQTGTVLLIVLVIAGQFGIGVALVTTWPYTAENFPTPMRAMAVGFISSFARVASMCTPLFVGVVLATSKSVEVVFAGFGVCALGALFLWLVASRETARTRLEDL